MDIFTEPTSARGNQVLVLGTFDGLHRGHMHLMERAREASQQQGGSLGVLTFEPDPEVVLRDVEPTDRRLLSRPDKMAILRSIGIDTVYEIPFDQQFARLDAAEFIRQYLLRSLSPSCLCVGTNFRFGRHRDGDPEMLRERLGEAGIPVEIVEPLREGDEPISSTRIRELLRDGEPARARELTGRPYVVNERVMPGEGLGREIGFPTLNFPITRTIHPRQGVYSVWLDDEKLLPGVANFGQRPTVQDGDELLLEVHALKEVPSLTPGDRARVYVMDFLREEMDFDGVETLKEQIERDTDRARESLDDLGKPDSLPPSPVENDVGIA